MIDVASQRRPPRGTAPGDLGPVSSANARSDGDGWHLGRRRTACRRCIRIARAGSCCSGAAQPQPCRRRGASGARGRAGRRPLGGAARGARSRGLHEADLGNPSRTPEVPDPGDREVGGGDSARSRRLPAGCGPGPPPGLGTAPGVVGARGSHGRSVSRTDGLDVGGRSRPGRHVVSAAPALGHATRVARSCVPSSDGCSSEELRSNSRRPAMRCRAISTSTPTRFRAWHWASGPEGCEVRHVTTRRV
jgi:hypothetical protein